MNFIATGHRNYAELAFNFIAQVEFLLSLRKSAQLLNNRTVHLHGEEGRYVTIDYALELLHGKQLDSGRHRQSGKIMKELQRYS